MNITYNQITKENIFFDNKTFKDINIPKNYSKPVFDFITDYMYKFDECGEIALCILLNSGLLNEIQMRNFSMSCAKKAMKLNIYDKEFKRHLKYFINSSGKGIENFRWGHLSLNEFDLLNCVRSLENASAYASAVYSSRFTCNIFSREFALQEAKNCSIKNNIEDNFFGAKAFILKSIIDTAEKNYRRSYNYIKAMCLIMEMRSDSDNSI